MKKLLSSIIVVCMLITCMASIGVFAAEANITAYVVEKESTVDVTIKVTGPLEKVMGITAYVAFDKTAITYDSFVAAADMSGLAPKATAYAKKTPPFISVTGATTEEVNMPTIADGEVLVVGTLTFNKVADGTAVTASTIDLTKACKAGIKAGYSTISSNGSATYKVADTNASSFITDFTPYTPVVEDKTTTFEKVYKADDGKSAAVFGKAPAGTTEAGLYIEKDGVALEHKTAMGKTTKGAGYFPAYTSDITAAFGVIVRDLAPGNYSAKIYADNTFGDAQSFTIAE